jgi:hypothetical protein
MEPGYQSQSEQYRARRLSSEDSCKPNSRRKIGRKQGQEKFWYQRKQKEQWQVESHNDPTEMITSMAYHNGDWMWKLHTFRGKVPGVYYPVKVMSLILCSATSARLLPSCWITTDVLGRHLTVETERIKNILKVF